MKKKGSLKIQKISIKRILVKWKQEFENLKMKLNKIRKNFKKNFRKQFY